jgi:pyridinium-3,5-biscarboxylic acid mononucleotide synthase
MDERILRSWMKELRLERITDRDLINRLKDLPFRDLGFAKVDNHRALRCGLAEVIFCDGKTPDRVVRIAREILRQGSNLLATRSTSELFELIRAVDPKARWHEDARCVTVERKRPPPLKGTLLIVTGGTSDIPVAEETRVTAEAMGARVKMIHDVGVAGIHRLLRHRKELEKADVLVVAAGMEGALASVVGGLVRRPVIAVPTSVGYGASFGGLAALLAMLNSCAAGVTVVNIDNGFGAGRAAALMLGLRT